MTRMLIEHSGADPRRAQRPGVGGAIDDPAVRDQRGSVQRARRFPRLRARLWQAFRIR